MGLYRHVIFPRLTDFVMSRASMMEQRHRTLAQAHGDVLEIGFGTGLNLGVYPDAVSHLTALDPERVLPQRVARRIELARMPVVTTHVTAECLPFDANRFDVVVSTWTLCTIPDVMAALTEARRVLKPGGRLLFVEHGKSDDRRVARLQDRYNGLQRIIGVGCNLNRPIDRLVLQAGFEITQLDRFLLPRAPRILAETYRGTAVAR